MADELKLKITFEDKLDSWEWDKDEKYRLTAANVNEIKEVVNNISQRTYRHRCLL